MSPRRAGARPTLALVAEAAGTSIPTVSKVLRGGTDVSAETRARVMDAVREVGYSRAGARSDAPAEDAALSNVVDLVVLDVQGSWANLVLTGVGREAAANGLDVVLTLAEPGTDWVSRVLRRRTVGTVVALVDPTSRQFTTLAAAGVPVVLIESMSTPPTDVLRVGVANWDGGRSAAEHFLSLGHRRLGVIAGHPRHMYSRARVDGFRAAVDTSATRDATTTVAYGQWSPEKAAAATHAMLDKNPGITGIFTCSDPMALGVYDALAERGLSIPADVSVIGFDDLPEAHWISPTLTTVRQPTIALGAAAVKALLELSRNGESGSRPPTRMELTTELVVRASTGPAPRAR